MIVVAIVACIQPVLRILRFHRLPFDQILIDLLMPSRQCSRFFVHVQSLSVLWTDLSEEIWSIFVKIGSIPAPRIVTYVCT